MTNLPGFKAIFFKGINRFACKKNIVILAALILLLQCSLFKDSQEYQVFMEKSKEFQANEALAFKKMANYSMISGLGINILFSPSSSGGFFTHPPLMSELSANINTIVTLDIKNNSQGKSLFKSSSIFQMTFSSILLLLGTLASLFIGINAFCDKAYLKSQCSTYHEKFIFGYTLLSQFILIIACFLLILIITLCHAAIQGIFKTVIDYSGMLAFTAVFLINAAFFFLIGVIISFTSSLRTKIAVLLIIWIIFSWLIPIAFHSLITNEANTITSQYKVYNDKLTVVENFEKGVLEKEGQFDKTKLDIFRKLAEEYWNNDFKQIEAKDGQFEGQIARVIQKYYNYFMLTPTTFYYASTEALSSRGYNNFINFSDYVWDMRRKFVRFWIDRVYYHDPKELVSFIKEDENIFKARAQLPENFASGILLNLIYVIILLGISYFLFERYYHISGNKEPVKTNNPIISIPKGQIKTLWVTKNAVGFCERLYNLLSGKFYTYHKNEPPIQLKIEDVDYTENRVKADFYYVCHPDKLPEDMKVKDFINFNIWQRNFSKAEETETRAHIFSNPGIETIKNKYIGKLNKEQKGEVMLSVLPYYRHKIYLVDTVTEGMSLAFIIRLNEIMKDWVDRGAAVIFLTLDREIRVENAEILAKDINFHEQEMWSITVSRLKELGY